MIALRLRQCAMLSNIGGFHESYHLHRRPCGRCSCSPVVLWTALTSDSNGEIALDHAPLRPTKFTEHKGSIPCVISQSSRLSSPPSVCRRVKLSKVLVRISQTPVTHWPLKAARSSRTFEATDTKKQTSDGLLFLWPIKLPLRPCVRRST